MKTYKLESVWKNGQNKTTTIKKALQLLEEIGLTKADQVDQAEVTTPIEEEVETISTTPTPVEEEIEEVEEAGEKEQVLEHALKTPIKVEDGEVEEVQKSEFTLAQLERSLEISNSNLRQATPVQKLILMAKIQEVEEMIAKGHYIGL